MRDLAPETVEQLEADHLVITHLVDLELDPPTGTIRVTDAYRDISWQGATWTRSGHFLSISDVEETAALLVNNVTVSFSGVDQSMIALVLSENYLDRTVRIQRAYLDSRTGAVVSVEPYFEGRVNKPAIAEDIPADDDSDEPARSTVSLEVTSAWVDFERSPGRTTNHEQQQQWFPGDMGFEFAHNEFREIPWGRP